MITKYIQLLAEHQDSDFCALLMRRLQEEEETDESAYDYDQE